CVVRHQIAPGRVLKGDGTSLRERAKFEPGLHLVKPAIAVVGEALLHDIGVGGLRVFHQGAAAMAVDIYSSISPIEPGYAQRAQKAVNDLLALNAGVITGAVAGLVKFVKRSRAEEFVVVRKGPFVMAKVAVGGIKSLMIRTAGEASLSVVDDAVAIDDSTIVGLVAEVRKVDPAVDVCLSDPEVIDGEAAA